MTTVNIQEMLAKSKADKERKQREAMERFKESPFYQRMKEVMAEKAKEKK